MTTPTTAGPAATKTSIIPTLRYRDAAAAVAWLGRAFGFAEHFVARGEDGAVHHAQLTSGNGLIMLGPARDDAFGKLVRLPGEVGGVGTHCTYVVVADPDSHHARAVAAGARVVSPLRDEEYGGRGYACLDPEGHLWSFGSYDPWA